MNAIRSFINKQNFNPNFLGVFVNPFFIARKNLYKNIEACSGEVSGRILDVGCGRKPYKALFKSEVYIGIDIENEGHDHTNEDIDVYYDGKVFPFEDECFDSVLTFQVFEHVFTPNKFMKEINRVLKPGGKLLLAVPFVWDEHEQPNDYARYSSFGLTSILKENGFTIVSLKKSSKGFSAIAQLTIGYLYKLCYSKYKILNGVVTVLLSPLTIFLLLISMIIPSSEDFYLDNIVLASKKI
jgi:SAM-dependent methyltransferase